MRVSILFLHWAGQTCQRFGEIGDLLLVGLFTGIEFDRVQPTAKELEGWQVKWCCLDSKGGEFTVIAEYAPLP